MHSIFARTQFEHGFSLLHRTFLLRQVTQERGFRPLAEDVEAERAGCAADGDALEVELERLGDSARRARWELSGRIGLVSLGESTDICSLVSILLVLQSKAVVAYQRMLSMLCCFVTRGKKGRYLRRVATSSFHVRAVPVRYRSIWMSVVVRSLQERVVTMTEGAGTISQSQVTSAAESSALGSVKSIKSGPGLLDPVAWSSHGRRARSRVDPTERNDVNVYQATKLSYNLSVPSSRSGGTCPLLVSLGLK